MNEMEAVRKTKFQQLVNPQTGELASSKEESFSPEPDYMWHGQRFRVVTLRQAPLLQFRLTMSSRSSMQIKYAYLTHHEFIQQNAANLNEILLIVRDSIRFQIIGYNLLPLDDALLMQRVVEIQSVSELQAAAALKQSESSSVIIELRMEYGRFDVENCIWTPGNGYWCERQRSWISQLAPPSYPTSEQ
ncbi:MAG: hypothetical protein KDB03_22800 [Planctomycetales bacterium]|nr:hypothetical protein [Planctomycetales bacterium]